MKAAVLTQIPGELEIEEVGVDAPAANEVLVQVVASGLCHSDLHFMEGLWQTRLPAVMGHEGAGIVEAVGSDVTYVKPGDHVITCLSVFCGKCRWCLSGHLSLCDNPGAVGRAKGTAARLTNAQGEQLQQFARLGAFAEQMLVHENAVVKIRDEMPLDRAAADRLRGHHRPRRRLPHRPGRAGLRGGGHRGGRHRARRHPGRPHRGGVEGHRHRRGRQQARRGPPGGRHPRRQRQRDRRGRGGQGADRRRGRLLLRGHRPQGHRRAGLGHAATPAAPPRSSAWSPSARRSRSRATRSSCRRRCCGAR